MRSERGAVPAFLLVLALLVAFAVVAFFLFSGEGPETAGDQVESALAKTDEDGEAPHPSDDPSDRTEREASQTELLPTEAPAEEAVDPNAIPPDATGLTGVIVDKSGAPAAAVEVTISRSVSRRQADEFDVEIESGKSSGRYERRVTTDETGRFTAIELIAEDGYQIEIETDEGRIGRKQNVTVIAKLLQEIGHIPLRDGARVRGRVRTLGGAPIAGARVRFGWDWGGEPIVTGEKGRFDAGVLFPGKHEIRVAAEGYALADNVQREFVEGDDVDDLELIVVPAAPIRGRVLDVAGRGVAEAWINVNRQGRTMFAWFSDQTTSAADGTFAFESIPAGDYDLHAGKNGYRYANKSGITAGGPPIELRLAKAGLIQGMVLDARTGTPIEAEKIQLHWVPQWRKNDPNAGLEEYYAGDSAECGADGSFSVGLDDGGTFVAEAFADGYAPGRSERFELEDNGTVTGVIVRLERGLSLTVKVTDAATGLPVARTVVDIHRAAEPGTDGNSERSVLISALGYAGGDMMIDHGHGGGSAIGERIARVLTDDGGEAVCTSIFPGTFVAKATRPEYAPAKIEGIMVARGASPPPVEIGLTLGGAIEGTVTSDRGAPEPALRVFASNAEGRAGEAVSVEGGRYRIENLAAGRYDVEAENPDGDQSRRQRIFMNGGNQENQPSEAEKFPLIVEEGKTATKDLIVERIVPGQLAGSVMINGRPQADVQVMANLVQPDGNISWDWGNAARTDDLGKFRFRRLKPGSYDLLVHRSWSEMYQGGAATVTSGMENLVTIDIGLGGIAGVVVDGAGKPLEGVHVRANRKQESNRHFFFGGANQSKTGQDGTFRIEDLQEGVFDLNATKQGYVTRTEEGVRVSPHRETSGLRLVMDVGGWIKVTVVGGKAGDRLRISGQLPGEAKSRNRWIRLDEQAVGWAEIGEHEGTGEMTVTERGENARSKTVVVAMTKGKNAEVTVAFD